MPIKKENFALYPHNWRKISWWIINIRAQNQCEGEENGERCGAMNHKLHPITGKKVVLSVAHLDHNPQNSDQQLSEAEAADLSKSNMRAFCQRCHNRWDREHRNESIKQTYREKHGEVPEPVDQIAEEVADEIIDQALVKMYMEQQQEQTVEQLKQTLRLLIEKLPTGEAIQHSILLQSLELQDEYRRLLSLSAKEFNTLTVETQLTVCKKKFNVIEQLQSLNKTISRARQGFIPQRHEPDRVEPVDDTPDEPLNVRGLGIRKIMANKKHGHN